MRVAAGGSQLRSNHDANFVPLAECMAIADAMHSAGESGESSV
jgi:hypothetical protein